MSFFFTRTIFQTQRAFEMSLYNPFLLVATADAETATELLIKMNVWKISENI